MRVDFNLYLISDRKIIAPEAFWRRLEVALREGLRAFQLREKDLCDRDLAAMAAKARALTRRYGCKLFINGRFDIAKAVEADGVHLPEDGLPVQDVRRHTPRGFLIGKSTHSPAAALYAQKNGADFITFGPVFETPSKRQYGPPKGLDALQEVCAKTKIPVFALGGIDRDNTAEVLRAGAFGCALISGFWRAKRPEASMRTMLKGFPRRHP